MRSSKEPVRSSKGPPLPLPRADVIVDTFDRLDCVGLVPEVLRARNRAPLELRSADGVSEHRASVSFNPLARTGISV